MPVDRPQELALPVRCEVRVEKRQWLTDELRLRRSEHDGRHVLCWARADRGTTGAGPGQSQWASPSAALGGPGAWIEWPCLRLSVNTQDWMCASPRARICLRDDAASELGTIDISASGRGAGAAPGGGADLAAFRRLTIEKFLAALIDASREAKRDDTRRKRKGGPCLGSAGAAPAPVPPKAGGGAFTTSPVTSLPVAPPGHAQAASPSPPAGAAAPFRPAIRKRPAGACADENSKAPTGGGRGNGGKQRPSASSMSPVLLALKPGLGSGNSPSRRGLGAGNSPSKGSRNSPSKSGLGSGNSPSKRARPAGQGGGGAAADEKKTSGGGGGTGAAVASGGIQRGRATGGAGWVIAGRGVARPLHAGALSAAELRRAAQAQMRKGAQGTGGGAAGACPGGAWGTCGGGGTGWGVGAGSVGQGQMRRDGEAAGVRGEGKAQAGRRAGGGSAVRPEIVRYESGREGVRDGVGREGGTIAARREGAFIAESLRPTKAVGILSSAKPASESKPACGLKQASSAKPTAEPKKATGVGAAGGGQRGRAEEMGAPEWGEGGVSGREGAGGGGEGMRMEGEGERSECAGADGGATRSEGVGEGSAGSAQGVGGERGACPAQGSSKRAASSTPPHDTAGRGEGREGDTGGGAREPKRARDGMQGGEGVQRREGVRGGQGEPAREEEPAGADDVSMPTAVSDTKKGREAPVVGAGTEAVGGVGAAAPVTAEGPAKGAGAQAEAAEVGTAAPASTENGTAAPAAGEGAAAKAAEAGSDLSAREVGFAAPAEGESGAGGGRTAGAAASHIPASVVGIGAAKATRPDMDCTAEPHAMPKGGTAAAPTTSPRHTAAAPAMASATAPTPTAAACHADTPAAIDASIDHNRTLPATTSDPVAATLPLTAALPAAPGSPTPPASRPAPTPDDAPCPPTFITTPPAATASPPSAPTPPAAARSRPSAAGNRPLAATDIFDFPSAANASSRSPPPSSPDASRHLGSPPRLPLSSAAAPRSRSRLKPRISIQPKEGAIQPEQGATPPNASGGAAVGSTGGERPFPALSALGHDAPTAAPPASSSFTSLHALGPLSLEHDTAGGGHGTSCYDTAGGGPGASLPASAGSSRQSSPTHSWGVNTDLPVDAWVEDSHTPPASPGTSHYFDLAPSEMPITDACAGPFTAASDDPFSIHSQFGSGEEGAASRADRPRPRRGASRPLNLTPPRSNAADSMFSMTGEREAVSMFSVSGDRDALSRPCSTRRRLCKGADSARREGALLLAGCGRGLPNLGNTCYLNATLQLLGACGPFVRALERLSAAPGIAPEAEVARGAFGTGGGDSGYTGGGFGGGRADAQFSPTVVATSPPRPSFLLLPLLSRHAPPFRADDTRSLRGLLRLMEVRRPSSFLGGGQQDAHEWLCEMLEALEGEANNTEGGGRGSGGGGGGSVLEAIEVQAMEVEGGDVGGEGGDGGDSSNAGICHPVVTALAATHVTTAETDSEGGRGADASPHALPSSATPPLCAVRNVFSIRLRTTLQCKACGHSSASTELLSHLSLNFPEPPPVSSAHGAPANPPPLAAARVGPPHGIEPTTPPGHARASAFPRASEFSSGGGRGGGKRGGLFGGSAISAPRPPHASPNGALHPGAHPAGSPARPAAAALGHSQPASPLKSQSQASSQSQDADLFGEASSRHGFLNERPHKTYGRVQQSQGHDSDFFSAFGAVNDSASGAVNASAFGAVNDSSKQPFLPGHKPNRPHTDLDQSMAPMRLDQSTPWPSRLNSPAPPSPAARAPPFPPPPAPDLTLTPDGMITPTHRSRPAARARLFSETSPHPHGLSSLNKRLHTRNHSPSGGVRPSPITDLFSAAGVVSNCFDDEEDPELAAAIAASLEDVQRGPAGGGGHGAGASGGHGVGGSGGQSGTDALPVIQPTPAGECDGVGGRQSGGWGGGGDGGRRTPHGRSGVASATGRSEPRMLSVSDLVAAFLAEEDRQWRCDECGSECASATYAVEHPLPQALLLHVKRFAADGVTGAATKKADPIMLDLDLSLAPWATRGAAQAEDGGGWGDGGSVDGGCSPMKGGPCPSYTLRSVVLHHGAHCSSGHYTCAARLGSELNAGGEEGTVEAGTMEDGVRGGVGGGVDGVSRDARWIEFDDRMTTELPTTALASEVFQKGAYLLLYQLEGGE